MVRCFVGGATTTGSRSGWPTIMPGPSSLPGSDDFLDVPPVAQVDEPADQRAAGQRHDVQVLAHSRPDKVPVAILRRKHDPPLVAPGARSNRLDRDLRGVRIDSDGDVIAPLAFARRRAAHAHLRLRVKRVTALDDEDVFQPLAENAGRHERACALRIVGQHIVGFDIAGNRSAGALLDRLQGRLAGRDNVAVHNRWRGPSPLFARIVPTLFAGRRRASDTWPPTGTVSSANCSITRGCRTSPV